MTSPPRVNPLVLLALAQCHRAPSPPPPRPHVAPEAARSDLRPLAPHPAPPPVADGPCAVDTTAARDLVDGRGDVRQMLLRGGPDDARISADVLVAGSARSYQWTLGATPSEPVVVERYDARLHGLSGAVRIGDVWRAVQYRAGARGSGGVEEGDPYETYPRRGAVVGVRLASATATPDLAMDYDFEEFVPSTLGSDVVFAAAGPALSCNAIGSCWREGGRGAASVAYDSRKGYEVVLGGVTNAALRFLSIAHSDCTLQYPNDEGGWVGENDPAADTTGDLRYDCSRALRDRPDAVALAVHPAHIAVAWRTRAGLSYALLPSDFATNTTVQPRVLAPGQVGAPAAAWDGDDLVVVWAQRPDAHALWSLAFARMHAGGDGEAPTVTPLATGGPSAFAPTLQISDGRTTLTWMEGDSGHGLVRVGSSHRGIEHAVDAPVALAANTPNARDPEVALGATGAGWLAWVEYPVGRLRGGLVRAAPLRCP
jgi:hypothetical protein